MPKYIDAERLLRRMDEWMRDSVDDATVDYRFYEGFAYATNMVEEEMANPPLHQPDQECDTRKDGNDA